MTPCAWEAWDPLGAGGSALLLTSVTGMTIDLFGLFGGFSRLHIEIVGGQYKCVRKCQCGHFTV